MVRIALLSWAILFASCGDPKKEVPQLEKKLFSMDAKERSGAALRLARIGSPHGTRTVPTLIRLLDDPNAGVRSAAAYALREMDTPQARSALDAHRHLK